MTCFFDSLDSPAGKPAGLFFHYFTVGNGYGRSAGCTGTTNALSAQGQRGTNSPEKSRRWQLVPRNGHNRSLQNGDRRKNSRTSHRPPLSLRGAKRRGNPHPKRCEAPPVPQRGTERERIAMSGFALLAMTVVIGGWPYFAWVRWLFRITPWNGHDRSLRLFVRKAENSPASFCIDAIYKHSKL